MSGERMPYERRRTAVADRVLREWGLTLPESFFRFWTFLEGLGPVERQAFADLDLAVAGVTDLCADPGLPPRDGVDVRVHGRYYRDPPEFLTFLHGGSDGLHYGLWSDDGRACDGVASYYTHDGGGIDRRWRTPLEALRARLERHWRDLEDDDAEPEYLTARRTGLERLRDALTALETGDRREVGLAYSDAHDSGPPPEDPDRITTLDSGGALVAGRTALDRPPHGGADEYRFARYVYGLFDDAAAVEDCVADALRWCADGDPAEALVLGRDLHWASAGDRVREAQANTLLVAAYRALGRTSLLEIAEAHHRHRDLPRVDVLDTGGV
ncbi:ADP-ribosylation family protein [Streptomyces cucumeris]|uniref:ADP-ribosylation family protein n=1 Tax=Streptomyces cucumeris TaxID=2962890 RepID=UPI003EBD9EAF